MFFGWRARDEHHRVKQNFIEHTVDIHKRHSTTKRKLQLEADRKET